MNCSLRIARIITNGSLLRRWGPIGIHFRTHLTVAPKHAAATLSSSSLLPSTKDEPRLPRTPEEIVHHLQPLTEFWGLEPPMKKDHLLFSASPNHHQLVSLLSLPLPGEPGHEDESTRVILRALYSAGNLIGTKYHDDKVHYRGLLEFSNICRCDCNYCGIRKSFKVPCRYTLDEETILETAKWCAEKRYGSIMLQSGEVQTTKRLKFLCRVIRRIVDETNLGVSLSVGELPSDYYQQLREAGAKRYLLRIETSNPDLFARFHPASQTFANRLDRLRALKATGFQVGTGIMIGLPGQTREDLANDLLFFEREDVDMIGMGPYILQRGTPTGELWEVTHPELAAAVAAKDIDRASKEQLRLLDAHNAAMFDLTTRMIALARILLKNVNIAATTAFQTMHPTGREVALMRGANILMPILTPTSHREHYQLYEGKVCLDESASQCSACLQTRVMSAGKSIAYDEHGDPPHALQRMMITQ